MKLLTVHKPLPSIRDSWLVEVKGLGAWGAEVKGLGVWGAEVKGLGVWGAEGNTVQSELTGPQHQTLTSLPVYINHHLSNWPGMGPYQHV